MKGRLREAPSFSKRWLGEMKRYLGIRERTQWIRIPRVDENEGIMMLGDPGTGKSQAIHHFLLQIARRKPAEAAIVYDPACEFIKRHYSKRRGDIVLNPLDQRAPFWSPSFEVNAVTDKKLVTESFLPGRTDSGQTSASGFFLKAARAILGRMLEFKPLPQDLVSWLSSAETIDAMVVGTEHAHLIPPNAHGQRAGVLGVLSDLGETLRLLPKRDECLNQISLREWAIHRKGWIFITSTMNSREALRPLQAVFINLLMKSLMSVSPEWGQRHPCWVIVDEVHSLHRLPALYESETEGRKYGLKLIQGTQGKAQYEEYYQALAKTMLAAPRLKLFFRCGEPESARWISDTIGDVEVERPKIGTTASVEDKGRDSLNYSTVTEHRPVISKEEIMSLPDLHGFWKYGDVVVPFRLPLAPVKVVANAFIPRVLGLNTMNQAAMCVVEPTSITEQGHSVTDFSLNPSGGNRRPETISPPQLQRKFQHEKVHDVQSVLTAREMSFTDTARELDTEYLEQSANDSEIELSQVGQVDPELESDLLL